MHSASEDTAIALGDRRRFRSRSIPRRNAGFPGPSLLEDFFARNRVTPTELMLLNDRCADSHRLHVNYFRFGRHRALRRLQNDLYRAFHRKRHSGRRQKALRIDGERYSFLGRDRRLLWVDQYGNRKITLATEFFRQHALALMNHAMGHRNDRDDVSHDDVPE